MATMPAIVVEASKPVLVAPAGPTPREFKNLSEIDSQEALNFQIPVIQYYKNEPKMGGRDPARVIKEALAKALVFYYPFAGRVREARGPPSSSSSRKLTVECTGEGVPFVEADANVSLKQLGRRRLTPPLPWLGKFLHDVTAAEEVTDCPPLSIQVTRLACGGFVVAVRFNHTMCDARGLVQFLDAVAELARTRRSIPTVEPAWERHLLTADGAAFDPSAHGLPSLPVAELVRRTCYGPEFPLAQLVERSFVFGPTVISSLKSHLPADRSATAFDVAAGCRTAALRLDPNAEVTLVSVVNCRDKVSPPLPAGYYGNVVAFAASASTAGRLCGGPLSYAVELVKKAKSEKPRGRSVERMDVGALVKGGLAREYMLSDSRYSGFERVDYGWGQAEYGGLATGGRPMLPGFVGYYLPFRNSLGEKGVVVSLCLPEDAMKRFVAEVESLIKGPLTEPHGSVANSLL